MKLITGLLKVIVAGAGCVIIAGCGSSGKQPAEAVQGAPDIEYTFEVDKNYQAVYRHILEQGRACTKPQFTAKMVVNGELLTDIKAADISIVLMGLFSNNHYLKIRVDALEENKSRIQVSNKLPRWNDLARAVKGWVVDESTQCEVSGNNSPSK